MLDKRLEKIDEKLEKISDRLGSIDTTLVRQEEQLAMHIRRTAILEKQIQPIERHVTQVSGVLKAVGILAMIGGIAEGAVAVLHYLKG